MLAPVDVPILRDSARSARGAVRHDAAALRQAHQLHAFICIEPYCCKEASTPLHFSPRLRLDLAMASAATADAPAAAGRPALSARQCSLLFCAYSTSRSARIDSWAVRAADRACHGPGFPLFDSWSFVRSDVMPRFKQSPFLPAGGAETLCRLLIRSPRPTRAKTMRMFCFHCRAGRCGGCADHRPGASRFRCTPMPIHFVIVGPLKRATALITARLLILRPTNKARAREIPVGRSRTSPRGVAVRSWLTEFRPLLATGLNASQAGRSGESKTTTHGACDHTALLATVFGHQTPRSI